MKKSIIYLSAVVLLLCIALFVGVSYGQSRAEMQLDKLCRTMSAMGDYEAAFVVSSGEERLLGRFAVAGDRYRIDMADMAVVGENGLRYEINKARREITLLDTETASADLLSNPAHAFERVGELYRPTLLGETDERVTLSLQHKEEQTPSIRLEIDPRTDYPVAIVYLVEGLSLKIEILSFSKLNDPLPPFDQGEYAGYELIDFR